MAYDCADVEYFHAEFRLAFTYLDIARRSPVAAEECVRRALSLYVVLSGWVQAIGRNEIYEQHLQRLRWHIGQAQDELNGRDCG